jgi:hypothetical protein
VDIKGAALACSSSYQNIHAPVKLTKTKLKNGMANERVWLP